jgi:AcrR family transcriptional regulator
MVQTASSPTRADRRRVEILRQAAEVFRRKGFHGAGMREIARGLGLAPGALYYYFRSKDDLLQACQEESLARLIDGAAEIARGDALAGERLAAIVRRHLDLTLDVMGGTAAHVEFRALAPERLRAVVRLRDRYERIVRRVIGDGTKDGSFRAIDPKMASLALLGALNWTVTWWRPEGRWSPEHLGSGFADLFLEGLRRPAAKEDEA